MILINKGDNSYYSSLAHRMLGPKATSADVGGALFKAVKDILFECGDGSTICAQATELEKKSLEKLMAVLSAGDKVKVTEAKPQSGSDVMRELMQKQEEIKKAQQEAYARTRAKEEAIMNEANYTAKADVESARSSAAKINKNDVSAKKLDEETASKLENKDSEGISLNDIMGGNKFIEEYKKYSGIPMVMADEESKDKTLGRKEAKEAPEAPVVTTTKRGKKKAK